MALRSIISIYESMAVYRGSTQWRRTRDVDVKWSYMQPHGHLMFTFDVSFDKTQRFISVRADSYMSFEI